MTNLSYPNVKLVWSASIVNIQPTHTKKTSVVGQTGITERPPNGHEDNYNINDHMNLYHQSTKTQLQHTEYNQTEWNSVRTENDKLLKLMRIERPVPAHPVQHRCLKHNKTPLTETTDWTGFEELAVRINNHGNDALGERWVPALRVLMTGPLSTSAE